LVSDWRFWRCFRGFSVRVNVGMREVSCWYAWCLGVLKGCGGGCERLCGRRRKLEEIDVFFYHVDWLKGCVGDVVTLYCHHHHVCVCFVQGCC